MAINIGDIFKQLEHGVTGIAESSLKDYLAQAQVDGKAFLTSMEDDLTTWTNLLATRQISEADFKDLVLGQKDLMKIVALKQAGIAAIQMDQFKQAVLNLVISTITTALKVV